jgi:hypothetical protein
MGEATPSLPYVKRRPAAVSALLALLVFACNAVVFQRPNAGLIPA